MFTKPFLTNDAITSFRLYPEIAGEAVFLFVIVWILSCPALSYASCSSSSVIGKVINVTDFGANGLDEYDDTDNIQNAINHTPEGGTLWIPAGRYLIDAVNWGIIPHDNMTILMSPDAVLEAIPNMKPIYFVVSLIHANNVTIIGGVIRGEREQHVNISGERGGQWGHALAMWESKNIIIKDLTVRDSWGDGIYIGDPDNLGSDNISICNVTAYNNRRQGLSITGANNVLVANSRFLATNGHQPKSGIDIEPYDDHKVTNVTIRNCEFRYNEGMGILVYRVTSENKNNILIYDNEFFKNESSGIFINESSGIQIYRNLFEENGGTLAYGWYSGIHLYRSSGVVIQQNTLSSLQDNKFGILFRGDSNDIQIVDNDICVGRSGNSIINYFFCTSCLYSKNTYCQRQAHQRPDLTMIYRILLFH